MLHLTVNNHHTFDLDPTLLGTGVDVQRAPGGAFSVVRDGRSCTVQVERFDKAGKEIVLTIGVNRYTVKVEEPLDRLLQKMGLDVAATASVQPLRAPMPGLVLRVLVEPGAAVQKGDSLVVLEAMKMENVLKASAPGMVKAVAVQEKTAVEKGAVLVEWE